MTAGRPTKYTEELAAYICEKIATTPRSVRKVCEEDPLMPNEGTLRQWCFRHEEFSRKYHQAVLKRYELVTDELENISEETHTYYDKEGNERYDAGYVAHKKLVIDTKMWIASRMLPKKFGQNPDSGQGAAQSLLEMLAKGIAPHHQDKPKEDEPES